MERIPSSSHHLGAVGRSRVFVRNKQLMGSEAATRFRVYRELQFIISTTASSASRQASAVELRAVNSKSVLLTLSFANLEVAPQQAQDFV